MKKILVMVLSVTLISCMVTKKEHNEDVDQLKAEIAALQAQVQSGYYTVNGLSMALNQSRELLASLEDQLHDLLVSNQASTAQIQELKTLMASLQQISVTQQAALAELQSGLRVVGVIDFCGATASAYNEVGLRMSDGSTLAYFESQGNRFLTILKPSTTYKTTDGTNCTFSTNAAGLVCDNYGCR